MGTIRIEVPSERGPYPVLVGPNTLTRLTAILATEQLAEPAVIVTCGPVWRHLAPRLARLSAAKTPLVIPDGERAKALPIVGRLYEAFVRRRLERSSLVLAVGGGVVGDVAGFAAATFLRGLRVVHVPTTVLAQVDSAVGGKVGVNLAAGKNLVGAFHPPALVVCDPTVLVSLPRREFRAGLYEVVKYGVIASRPLFDRVSADIGQILDRDPALLGGIVSACCQIKADVVGRDERESGLRRILNFGHTVGHALEAVTRYRRFRHGEAIAYGMLAAARLSVARGTLTAADEARLADLIQRMGPLPPVADLSMSETLAAIRLDKKVAAGRLHFVLAAGLGETRIVSDVTPRELRQAMRAIGLRR